MDTTSSIEDGKGRRLAIIIGVVVVIGGAWLWWGHRTSSQVDKADARVESEIQQGWKGVDIGRLHLDYAKQTTMNMSSPKSVDVLDGLPGLPHIAGAELMKMNFSQDGRVIIEYGLQTSGVQHCLLVSVQNKPRTTRILPARCK